MRTLWVPTFPPTALKTPLNDSSDFMASSDPWSLRAHWHFLKITTQRGETLKAIIEYTCPIRTYVYIRDQRFEVCSFRPRKNLIAHEIFLMVTAVNPAEPEVYFIDSRLSSWPPRKAAGPTGCNLHKIVVSVPKFVFCRRGH